ncbi:TPA: N-acetylneuraminate synthase [Campylobacter upsaliensis]|uniref:N-acetylneuraminate synthase n=1 Tax=Campylobacter upsaliensis TaxID=28080 RepID=UPI0012758D2A|nr:N-acetylneuraminate synthase [Campylobacter upsaliensis]EAJ7675014.1 N-acetylneuraminate synthase [Campylobacter upsaliensis]EJL4569027.1 N-acetylneuraminate synthase [Campylobacter upsaliensis]HEC1539636.1 N-acetylneuraminate synthase [Campylobacter upsaliensis]HEC1570405.1 N-acetylneuraminate synthase [Campylobacter upsaliensis]HEF3566528.1 N-acetylneuraminate synthase [Campylobacter upsaliensis]
MKKVLIIAEAGVNHNGDINLAKKLIEQAAKAGADVVKFQTFKANSCVSVSAKKAKYQLETTAKEESQLEMIQKLELSYESHFELMKHCKKHGIAFLSTPFDLESVEFLRGLDLPYFKIPSGEITNLPYLKAVAKCKKKVLLSTGMANLGEIEAALTILRKNGTRNITLLHCNTEYPTPFEDVNLNALKTLKEAFKLEVGYSDHTEGIVASLGAVALGAVVIEKHFTLDKTMEGPDHRASLEFEELKALCKGIRELEKALGSGIKKASKSEAKNKIIARKSLVAKREIQKGEKFSEQNLTTKRPGSGISAMRYEEYLGKRALKTYKKDELINE